MTLSKTQRRLSWILGFFALFLLLLPEGIRFGGQYALKELGAESAKIDDVDLNLFVGTVALEGVQIGYDQKETLTLGAVAVDIDMLALFSQRVLIEKLTLNTLSLDVYEQNENWVVGIPLPQASEEESEDSPEEDAELAWRFGINTIDLKDLNIEAKYQADTHKLTLNDFFADKLYMWQPDDLSSLKLGGQFNGADFVFSGDLKPFAEARSFNLAIQLKDLNLGFVNPFLPETISNLGASLNIDTRVGVTLQKDGGIGVQQKGVVALALNQVNVPDVEVSAKDIRWNGSVNVSIAKGGEPQVSASGAATVKGIDTTYEPLQVQAGVQTVAWTGDVGLDVKDINNSLKSKGQVKINGLSVEDKAEPFKLASWESLHLTDVVLNGLDSLQLATVNLKSFEALKGTEPETRAIGSFGDLTIKDISLETQNDLNIAEVILSDLNGELERSADGKLVVLDSWLEGFNERLASLQKEPEASNTPEEANITDESVSSSDESKAKEFAFSIGSVRLAGANQLVFMDSGMKPPMKHPVSIETFSMGAISSKAKAQVAPLDIHMSLYDHGLLKLNGNLSPLQALDNMNADLTLAIKGIELPELSGYIEPALGYRANSGQLNVSGKALIENGRLDSETQVKVLRVDFEPVDQELIKKLGKHLTMPVDTALNIITDSDDTLEIDIPVKGDLANPDIHINTIVAGAVAQAVQNAAMTYFKYAVQPFGAIMLVSETIGDMHMQAKFQDVRFVPGTEKIVSEQDGYLEKVAGMIKEKDGFSVLICVVVTDQDFQARQPPVVMPEGKKYQWDELATQLAKRRSDFIKKELIKTHGLEPDRVQSCQSQLAKGEPHAVMGI